MRRPRTPGSSRGPARTRSGPGTFVAITSGKSSAAAPERRLRRVPERRGPRLVPRLTASLLRRLEVLVVREVRAAVRAHLVVRVDLPPALGAMNHRMARARYGHPGYKIKPDGPSEIFDRRLAFLRFASTRLRRRRGLAGLLAQRLDPSLRRRRHERLPARLTDEDFLLQVFPEAVELRMHLPFLAPGAVQVGFVAGVLRHEHDDTAGGAPPGPTPPLNRPDFRRDGFVEDDEVDLGNVESLFADRGGDEDVHLAPAELVEDVDLLFLREADVLPARGLADEPHRSHARDAGEILRDPVRRLAVVGEDDDLRVRFLHELLADNPTGLRELRMLDLRGLGELDRLLRLGVLQELDVRLRLRVLLHVLEIQSEGAEPLRLREFDRVVRLHRDGLSRHRAVPAAILDAGIQTLAGLVSDRQEVLARDLRSAREEPELLQAGDLFIDDGLEELPDLLGDVRRLHRNPLDPQVVLVWHLLALVLRSALDRGDAEVPAHLEDLLRGGTG